MMGRSKRNNRDTAALGRDLVREQLLRRGAGAVEDQRVHRRSVLRVTNQSGTDHVVVYVKTKRSGSWQGSTRDSDFAPSPGQEFYWVLVDAAEGHPPTFYVVPGSWMQADIRDAHQEYLGRHGGVRAISPDSEHHAIRLERIEE